MELYQLQAFVHIAETRNMTRSAKVLNISLSALSTQIKNLEQSLETRLFARGPKGMMLTHEGEKLLESARQVLDTADQMRTKAARLKAHLSGTINVGINTDPGFLKISSISEQMIGRFPNVKISFIESQTFETIKMLHADEIDLGFHYGALNDPLILTESLSAINICVVVPKRFSKYQDADFKTISQLPWVWTRHECPFHVEFEKVLDQNKASLNQVTDAVEENIVRELVKSGAGLGLMRKDEALGLVDQDKGVIWQGFELEVPLGLACFEKRKSEPLLAGFLSVVRDIYQTC